MKLIDEDDIIIKAFLPDYKLIYVTGKFNNKYNHLYWREDIDEYDSEYDFYKTFGCYGDCSDYDCKFCYKDPDYELKIERFEKKLDENRKKFKICDDETTCKHELYISCVYIPDYIAHKQDYKNKFLIKIFKTTCFINKPIDVSDDFLDTYLYINGSFHISGIDISQEFILKFFHEYEDGLLYIFQTHEYKALENFKKIISNLLEVSQLPVIIQDNPHISYPEEQPINPHVDRRKKRTLKDFSI